MTCRELLKIKDDDELEINVVISRGRSVIVRTNQVFEYCLVNITVGRCELCDHQPLTEDVLSYHGCNLGWVRFPVSTYCCRAEFISLTLTAAYLFRFHLALMLLCH